MFRFIKKAFFTGLTILSSVNLLSAAPLNATQLKCVPMNNQECKARPEIFNAKRDEPVFYLLKQVNAVVVVTISIIHVQKCVFLMLLKR